MIDHKSEKPVDLFKGYWYLVRLLKKKEKKKERLRLHYQCGLNDVPSQIAFPQRQEEEGEGEEEGGDSLSGDCLFVVFTVEPLRTPGPFPSTNRTHNQRVFL